MHLKLSRKVNLYQSFYIKLNRLLAMYTLIRISWAASGSLLKFPLYDFNDYDDNWGRF